MLRWPTKITKDMLLEIGRANPGKFELAADGTLIMTPPTGTSASLGEGAIYEQVVIWRNTHAPDDFVIPSTGGISLPDGAVWAPDTTWIKADTYDRASDEDLDQTYWRLVPDGIFERLSPSDTVGSEKYNKKMASYFDNAVRLLVVLDPKLRRSLTSLDGGPFVESFDNTLDLGSHMPGFVLDVAAVFADDSKRRRERRPS
jgi:Uma2 family endonuclease